MQLPRDVIVYALKVKILIVPDYLFFLKKLHFSRAADIVSGAYPMASRLSPVVRQLFSNCISFLNFIQSFRYSGFWSFSQKVFTISPWPLVYMYIRGTFKCVQTMVPEGHIFASKWSPKESK